MAGDIVDFAAARDRRLNPPPDPEHVFTDEHGQQWFEFLCAYADADGEFSFTIWAKDFEDAERRMNVLRQTAVVSGQIYSEEAV